MSIIVNVKDLEKPRNCSECPFCSKLFYVCIDFEKDLFTQHGYCQFAYEFSPDDDPVRTSKWLLHNVEPWCPISEVKDESKN